MGYTWYICAIKTTYMTTYLLTEHKVPSKEGYTLNEKNQGRIKRMFMVFSGTKNFSFKNFKSDNFFIPYLP